MQVHPGKKIQEELKDRGWTQRQFAFLLGKKVSEVNELIKGKRNVTVQRDILLSHVLGTSRKYRLNLQNEYDYALLEADFDMSKLPKPENKHGSTSINVDEKLKENNHKKSEQEEKNKENKSSVQSLGSSPVTLEKEYYFGGQEIEKKETKPASDHQDNLHKGHKINKDVDISTKQEKHQNLASKKDEIIAKKNEKIVLSKQELPTLDPGRKTTTPEGQEKKDDHKDHHKHKEHIFRNF